MMAKPMKILELHLSNDPVFNNLCYYSLDKILKAKISHVTCFTIYLMNDTSRYIHSSQNRLRDNNTIIIAFNLYHYTV